MTSPLDLEAKYFTDFDGRFKARLAAVIPTRAVVIDARSAPTTAKYDCRIKVEYNKDLMRLIEEGMLVAVRNFKSNTESPRKYTLMEISRVYPEHYGLRGLSDHAYYPLQFEVIDQSVADWASDDRSTLMVQISAIPTNYDFIINSDKQPEYVKGFSYPVIGERVHVLNKETVDLMYNHKILKKLPRLDVQSSVGTMKMFEADPEKVPIYVDFENLVRYHFGIFAFTGGGKSNLVSTLVRKILRTLEDVKVVIFDISQEYPFLLLDVFQDSSIPSKIILDSPAFTLDEFHASVVKPRGFEDDPRVKNALAGILRDGKVAYYVKPQTVVPTYLKILEDIGAQKEENINKPTYIEALDQIAQAVGSYMEEHGLAENDEIDEGFVKYLDDKARAMVDTYRVSEKSLVYGWASTRLMLLKTLEQAKKKPKGPLKGYTAEDIQRLIESDCRLACLSIGDPYNIKELVVQLASEFLRQRKRKFKVKPYILFVFDEAQEFAPSTSEARGQDRGCTDAVETLLRQGRKYGLGACLATQRIAYLNTSALQQLHTYFVGTLPRAWDRTVVSNAFMIDIGILEKTLEFAPGEWLLSSYIATGVENVPIFIKAENSEQHLQEFLTSYGRYTQ